MGKYNRKFSLFLSLNIFFTKKILQSKIPHVRCATTNLVAPDEDHGRLHEVWNEGENRAVNIQYVE